MLGQLRKFPHQRLSIQLVLGMHSLELFCTVRVTFVLSLSYLLLSLHMQACILFFSSLEFTLVSTVYATTSSSHRFIHHSLVITDYNCILNFTLLLSSNFSTTPLMFHDQYIYLAFILLAAICNNFSPEEMLPFASCVVSSTVINDSSNYKNRRKA